MTSSAAAGATVPIVPGPTLDDSYARAVPELVLDWSPTPAPEPRAVWVNDLLAADLGLDPEWLCSEDGIAVLSGSAVPEAAHTTAMAYAGHQFGGYSPRLGDGRALLLGELVGDDGARVDLHLKGSGRTPFARGGDGRATLGPMLREVLVSEALHALGVPTTRSLAVVATGEDVLRADGPEPGAVLTRVAASHIRVGTFEYAARTGGPDLVARLAHIAIARHHPGAAGADEPLLALLTSVVEAQARLVADWMLLGFIHGVMNTDNMTISGEGIDYGPCAFMDTFDPATVFSSIDHQGRYAFANQPPIAVWNLSRLAETLISAMRPDDPESMVGPATEVLQGFEDHLDRHWRTGMRRRLGLIDPPADPNLFEDLMAALQGDRLDLTSTFRRLAGWLRGDADLPAGASGLAAWTDRWRSELDRQSLDPGDVAATMDTVNPVHVPRNHLVDEALTSAVAGDPAPFETLLDVVTDPFTPRPGEERYAEPAPTDFTAGFQTFCGT